MFSPFYQCQLKSNDEIRVDFACSKLDEQFQENRSQVPADRHTKFLVRVA